MSEERTRKGKLVEDMFGVSFVEEPDPPPPNPKLAWGGMGEVTLRDVFAACVIAGIAADGDFAVIPAADYAYRTADEMLKRRQTEDQ